MRVAARLSILCLLLAGGIQLCLASETDADAAYRQGRELLRAGDAVGSVAAFERATRLRPGFAQAWLQLGIARSRGGDAAGSIEAYRALLRLEPDHAVAWHNLGNVEYRRGRLEQAAEAYGSALEADPQYLLAAYHHGWMLRQLGRHDEAERSLKLCLGLKPSSDRDRRTQIDCLFYLGTLQHRAGEFEDAAETMERVLEVFPAHAEANYYLGTAYRRLGRIDESRLLLDRHREILRARRSDPVAKDPGP